MPFKTFERNFAGNKRDYNRFDFPGAGIGNLQAKQYSRLAVNMQKCDFVANRLIDKYLYGADHPYGRVSSVDDIHALHGKTW